MRKGKLTAAHRTLPFGTIVGVINLENGRSVNARINDRRGPFKYHHVIDLAHGTASGLNMMRAGEIDVSLEVIERLIDQEPKRRRRTKTSQRAAGTNG